VTFLNKHNMISEAQNGFREKKCINTATQTFIEDIQKALDNKLLVHSSIHSFILFGIHNCYNSNTWTSHIIKYIILEILLPECLMGTFLDLTKASDVMHRKLLLAKLELYGLRGKIHSCMNSYRTGRTQFVELQQLDEKTSYIKIYDICFIK
jgi:hypothetical protein